MDVARGIDDRASFRRFDIDQVRSRRGWFFALGIGFMLLGILAILMPFAATLVTTLFLGWVMVIGGLIQGFHAVQNRRWTGWGWALAAGILQVLAGGLVVAYPFTGTLTLTLILASYFAANGLIKVVRAIQHNNMPRWGWLLFDGLLTLGLGVLILLKWPATAVWALGLLVGIDLLCSGSSMMIIAFAAGERVRREEAHA